MAKFLAAQARAFANTMSIPNLHTIASELNQKASNHPIGRLQEIRAELHHRRRAGRKIFSSVTTFRDWAFHFGGRPELQFNIGWEGEDGKQLRHGVAFSFEPSHTLPKPVGVLKRKVRLFNKFMRLHPDFYADMRMWYYKDGKQSRCYAPAPIPNDLIAKGVFIFLGKLQPSIRIDYESVLTDLDRLLELYRFTEGGGNSQAVSVPIQVEFRPGFKPKASSAIATQVRKQWKMTLRHNKLQKVLYAQLASRFGAENVRAEFSNVGRTSVDVVVRRGRAYWFYEIKTTESARECLREALGQVLEYAFWPPGARVVNRLVVVGEAVMDDECKKYLRLLKERFSLPVEYHRIFLK